MRHIRFFLATFLALATICAAQEPEKPAGPPLSLFAAPLVALENDLARAEKLHNLALIDSTLAPDFLEIAGNGRLYTKAEIMQVVKDVQIDDYALTDFHSVDVRDDVAVLTYQATVRGSYQGQPFPYKNLLSSVWHRQKGHWQLVFHTSNAVPQPPVSAAELEGLERDLVARVGDRDLASLKQIFVPDAVIVRADGKRITFEQFSGLLAQGPKLAYKISDISATPLGPDSGVVTCHLSAPGAGPEFPPYQVSSVWKRGASGWQVVFQQEAALK